MFATKHILPVINIALMLAGCGTYVPEIQEIPGDQAAGQALVQAIAASIHCEIKDAVTDVIARDAEGVKQRLHPPLADWLLGWGAQVQITLTVDEQSSFSPSGLYSPMSIFSLLGGVGVSAEATKIETLYYYYIINELYHDNTCLLKKDIDDSHNTNHPIGSLLIQSDLKLREWLRGVVTGRATGDISPTTNRNAKNTLQHEVSFKVITNGNITPRWKLVSATINPSPPLFMASRTRTHDLLITFGPNDPMTNSLGAGTPAANANLAAQIGLSIRNQMINNNLP
jgi:hypothetical protein